MSLLFLMAWASTYSNNDVLFTLLELAIFGAFDLANVPPIIVPPIRCVSLISVNLGDNIDIFPLDCPIPVETLILLFTNPLVTVLVDDLSCPLIETETFYVPLTDDF